MQPPTPPETNPGPPTLPPPSWLAVALASLAIAVMAVLAYANTFHVPFYFDDRQGITDNDTIEVLWPPWQALNAPMYHCSGAIGRPLVNFSLAVNYQLSQSWSESQDGRDPVSYHVVNLGIHIATAWLLLAVLWRTLRQPRLARRFGAAAFPLAFLIALAWAVHPLASETVTNAIQRNESMVSFFYLLVIYCFIRSTETPAAVWVGGAPAAFWWQAAGVAGCFLGVISKEVMFSAPMMVFLYDRTFVAGSFRHAFTQRWKYYGAMLTSWFLLAFLVIHYKQRGGTVGFDLPMSKYDYALKQCEAIITYFKLALWPHPLVLDYGFDVPNSIAAVWPQGLLLLVLLGVTGWALWKKPALGFAGAWVFLILAPSSSIMPLTTQTEAEHRMYMPLAAIIALVVLGVYAWAGPRLYYAAGVLILALAGTTYARNQDYRTELAAWYVNVAERPDNERAHYNLGCALLSEERYIDSAAEFILSLKIDPDYVDAHCNLGTCYSRLGDETSAMTEFETAVKLDATDVQSNYNLGCGYWNRNELDNAAEHLRIASENDPTYADALYSYGAVLVLNDRSEDAITPLKAALDLSPHDTNYLVYFGTALKATGHLNNAIAIFEKGLALDANAAGLHKKLADALADDGQEARALEEDKTVIRLTPSDAEALYLYGVHLHQFGKNSDAVDAFTKAIGLKPDYAEAENGLGRALLGLKRTPEARAAFDRALILKPDYAEAHLNLGQAFLADNQIVPAETQFREAVKADPDYAEAHNQLGLLLVAETRYPEAKQQFEAALHIDPDYAEADKNLKAVEAKLGGQ